MKRIALAAALLAASAFLGLPQAAGAQTAGAPQSVPQSTPLAGKTIGKPQQPQLVPSMIVLTARGAKLAVLLVDRVCRRWRRSSKCCTRSMVRATPFST